MIKLQSLVHLDLCENQIKEIPGILEYFHLYVGEPEYYEPINLGHRHLLPPKIKDGLLVMFTITSSIYHLPNEPKQIIGDECILQGE